MVPLFFCMKLRLSIHNDTLLLWGSTFKPVALENISSRLTQAKLNCEQANWNHLPVFIGAEHLAYLQQASKKFILIEKSPDYYSLLIDKGIITANPQAHVIFGDLGFAPPTLHASLSHAFLEQDLPKINDVLGYLKDK